jgi:signal peptide peptidase SppA
MSQIPRLLHALHEPLLLEPHFGRQLASVFVRKIAGAAFTGAELHADLGIPTPEQRQSNQAPARIAVIPVYGLIDQHPQSMGMSTEQVGARFDAALARSDVDGILLDVDSPGGTVSGVPELAAKIFAGRGTKPILALANSLAASAGYWIAAAADEVWVTPSGQVGSIGVYMIHEDWSAALEQQGVKMTPISYGKFKLEGAEFEPLSEEALAFRQARVDEIGAWFTKDVARFRNDTPAAVRAGYGQGRVLGARQAIEAKLADKVGTFDEAIARLAKRTGRGRRGMSAASRERELTLDERPAAS